MRSYGLYDASRGLTLALAAALAGLGLWGATQIGMQTTGRFWLSMAIVAGAGLLIALANHVGTWTKGLRLRLSPGTFVLAFVPVLVVGGWILIASQPGTAGRRGDSLLEQLDRGPRRRALDRPLARRAGVQVRLHAGHLVRRRSRAGRGGGRTGVRQTGSRRTSPSPPSAGTPRPTTRRRR